MTFATNLNVGRSDMWRKQICNITLPLPDLLCFSTPLILLSLRPFPPRLPQGSGHFGGAPVGGGSHFVPRTGRSADLEAAGYHPRQAGVCQIRGGARSGQVGHGGWRVQKSSFSELAHLQNTEWWHSIYLC